MRNENVVSDLVWSYHSIAHFTLTLVDILIETALRCLSFIYEQCIMNGQTKLKIIHKIIHLHLP